jgi:transposase
MLATTSGQVGFFDAAEVARPLPEGSFFALLAEYGHRIVRDEDFAACYSERMGRPSIPPSQLAKVMLLQYRTGASDEQAMECVAWDLRWKIALGLPVDHEGWHPTTLTKFRARLLLHKLERVALERTLEFAEELGMLDGAVEQIIDSTPMLGAAATQDTVRLVRHGVKKLLDAVASVDGEAADQLDRALEFDYARPNDKPDCRWREKAERERMLTRVAQDAELALQAIEQADQLLADDAVGEAHRLLRELIGQDFEIDQDGVPRLYRGTRAGRIISSVDTEMRHGRKSSQQRFDGYKLSTTATNSQAPLSRPSMSLPRASRTAHRLSSSSTRNHRAADRRGCWAIPPTAAGRSAPSWPSATSRCWRPCSMERSSPGAWASATSRSIWPPAR